MLAAIGRITRTSRGKDFPMSVPPDVLDASRRVLVGAFRCVAAIGAMVAITGALLAGVAFVIAAYTFKP
jgi:hypothetical protein